MKIIEGIEGYEKQFEAFNRLHWPKRKQDFRSHFKWRTTPSLTSVQFPPALLAIENEEIIGQIILVPTIFESENKKLPSVWGTDLLVSPSYRGTAAGMLLTKSAIRNFPHFGSGFSSDSLKLHLILGEKQIGEIKKFVGSTSLKSHAKGLTNSKAVITTLRQTFLESNIDAVDVLSMAKSRFTRSKRFMQWRFANPFYTYHIYNSIGCYFIARKSHIKGIPTLKLIDYRFEESSQFKDILSALDILAGHLNCPVKFVSCSLTEVNETIKKSGYRLMRTSPILSNQRLPADQEILVPPADSDADFW